MDSNVHEEAPIHAGFNLLASRCAIFQMVSESSGPRCETTLAICFGGPIHTPSTSKAGANRLQSESTNTSIRTMGTSCASGSSLSAMATTSR